MNQKLTNIQFTTEENIYYTKIYEKLNIDKEGKLNFEKTLYYMKSSGLNDEILKKIFSLIPKKDNKYIDRREFFIILKLIALAQNKMPYTIENLINNSSITFLPKFMSSKSKKKVDNNIFEINENIQNKYKKLFYENKDTKKDYITEIKGIILWKKQNYGDNVEKVLDMLKPLELPSFINLKEFIVICHLLSLSKNIQIPIKLPENIINFLGRNTIKVYENTNINKENNNNKLPDSTPRISLLNSNDKFHTEIPKVKNFPSFNSNNDFSYNKIQIENEINLNLKRKEELNKKNELINKRMKELYEEIQKLQKEQFNVQNDLTKLKNEYNDLIQKQKYCNMEYSSSICPSIQNTPRFKNSFNNTSKIVNNINMSTESELYNSTADINNLAAIIKKQNENKNNRISMNNLGNANISNYMSPPKFKPSSQEINNNISINDNNIHNTYNKNYNSNVINFQEKERNNQFNITSQIRKNK